MTTNDLAWLCVMVVIGGVWAASRAINYLKGKK